MVCRLPHASATQRGTLCAQVQQIQAGAGSGTGTDDGATGDVAIGVVGATRDVTSSVDSIASEEYAQIQATDRSGCHHGGLRMPTRIMAEINQENRAHFIKNVSTGLRGKL